MKTSRASFKIVTTPPIARFMANHLNTNQLRIIENIEDLICVEAFYKFESYSHKNQIVLYDSTNLVYRGLGGKPSNAYPVYTKIRERTEILCATDPRHYEMSTQKCVIPILPNDYQFFKIL
jgi:hypothetical protein